MCEVCGFVEIYFYSVHVWVYIMGGCVGVCKYINVKV